MHDRRCVTVCIKLVSCSVCEGANVMNTALLAQIPAAVQSSNADDDNVCCTAHASACASVRLNTQ